MTGSVWLIERGQYSSYEVLGVYDTRPKAQAVADMLNQDDDHNEAAVRKVSLNPGFDEVTAGRRVWSVHMARDGEGRANPWPYMPDGLKISRPKAKRLEPSVYGYIWAEDEAHALKIANEYRAQAIAEGRL